MWSGEGLKDACSKEGNERKEGKEGTHCYLKGSKRRRRSRRRRDAVRDKKGRNV